MSLSTILSDIGKGLKTFFTDAEKVAIVAEPFIDIAFPGIATLYNTTVTAVGNAETAAVAAGNQSGSGAQKLSYVVGAIGADFNTYWASIGNTSSPTTAQIEAWVNAVVASLNAIPASSSSSNSSSSSTSAVPVTTVTVS